MLTSWLALWLLPQCISAEDGYRAWLRYAPVPPSTQNISLPTTIIALDTNTSSPVFTAGQELQRGLKGIFGRTLTISNNASTNTPASSIIVGTVSQYETAYDELDIDEAADLEDDGFYLNTGGRNVIIVGRNKRGVLYGAFEYLSRLAQGQTSAISMLDNPHAPIRWTNEWNNLDGSIERGYAGLSIFFENGQVTNNTARVADYARLLSSIRINGIIVNNVNANATLLSAANMNGLKRLADTIRPYGIQLGISLNFASPQTFGGLNSYDPLNPAVISWWTNITNQLYTRVPDMAGYLVKANSEGQPGPLTYNRSLADGANMFAKAVEPHGGIVMFRAFVYNNQLNESIWTADRANAAVDFFKHLDGEFDDNVVVQIKYGPIDFQVREPASPLFSTLERTSTAVELQVTQEYLGQQSHLVYLAPLWKEILEFDMKVENRRASKVQDIISGETFKRPLGGFAGVVNVGTDRNWLGSHLAMSNLYAYGKLAWDPSLSAEQILQDWTRLTFGFDRQAIDTITHLSMTSWPAYENYTGNLGIHTLTDILYTHYGPNPASMDNNGWGQWTRADKDSIGMDRTVRNGTGNAGQYTPAIAHVFEEIETTPENLLLWFHHVPYTHRLSTNKTVIQHIYDTHYAGSQTVQSFPSLWKGLQSVVDAERFSHVLFRLEYQASHALIWRDSITKFYYNLSGIPDEDDRVGNYRYRIEAEDMLLAGYKRYAVNPFHAASASEAIVTADNSTIGTATANITFPSGWYDVAVNYYDMLGGKSEYQLFINNQTVGTWKGDLETKLGHAMSRYLDGHSATRVTFKQVLVQRGDVLRVVGRPDSMEPAPIDYISLLPPGTVD